MTVYVCDQNKLKNAIKTRGYVEVRALMPASSQDSWRFKGAWPAIWMLGADGRGWPNNGGMYFKWIILGGVEIKVVDFGDSVVSFFENLGEAKKFIKKFPNGGGRYLSKINCCRLLLEGF